MEYLISTTYLPCVQNAWNGLVSVCIHPAGDKNPAPGFIGYDQGSGKQPSDGQPLSYTKVPNFEDYTAGLVLLAGSEVYKLAQ